MVNVLQFARQAIKPLTQGLEREFLGAVENTFALFTKKKLQPALLGVTSRGQNVGSQSLRARFEQNILKLDTGDGFDPRLTRNVDGGGGGGGSNFLGNLTGGGCLILGGLTVLAGIAALWQGVIPGASGKDFMHAVTGTVPDDYKGKGTSTPSDTSKQKTNNANMFGK